MCENTRDHFFVVPVVYPQFFPPSWVRPEIGDAALPGISGGLKLIHQSCCSAVPPVSDATCFPADQFAKPAPPSQRCPLRIASSVLSDWSNYTCDKYSGLYWCAGSTCSNLWKSIVSPTPGPLLFPVTLTFVWVEVQNNWVSDQVPDQ